MRKLTITSIALAFSATFCLGAMADTMSKDDYKSGIENIEKTYTSDKKNCESLSGNANDICMAEASGKEKIAKADMEAVNKDNNKARYDALVVKADSDYSVAKEKCDDKSGNVKDVCIKEAQAAQTTAKADAKSQMKISDASNKANKDSANASHDANKDKRDADYSVANEKCNALAGDAKDNCLKEAKADYEKR